MMRPMETPKTIPKIIAGFFLAAKFRALAFFAPPQILFICADSGATEIIMV